MTKGILYKYTGARSNERLFVPGTWEKFPRNCYGKNLDILRENLLYFLGEGV